MYELSLLYPSISGTLPEMSWAYTFDDTVDGLPYIGPHRNFPHHLFALGLARHGVAAAWLAAKVLTRQVTGEPGKGDDSLRFRQDSSGPLTSPSPRPESPVRVIRLGCAGQLFLLFRVTSLFPAGLK